MVCCARDSYVERFGRATLNALPNNSLIITADDLKWGSLQYVQHCEGFRCDTWGVSNPATGYRASGRAPSVAQCSTMPLALLPLLLQARCHGHERTSHVVRVVPAATRTVPRR